MTYRRALISALATAALALGGCASGGDDAEPAATSDAAASFPVTVGDLTLAAQPQRIVSLAPTATEMLYAIDAGEQVVAVDDMSNYPADAPKTGLSGFQPSAEAIAQQNPDLVVLSNDIDGVVSQLEALKIPVFTTAAAVTLDDTYTQIGDLGRLTGHSEAATALTGRMRAEIDKIVQETPKRAAPLSYYYELDPTLYSATSKTFIGSIFAQFGLTNVADAADADGAKGGYPQVSLETLVAADPDVIFLADAKCCQQTPETVAARKGFDTMTAVKQGSVFALDDDIASRWGPRVVDLYHAVADALAKVPA